MIVYNQNLNISSGILNNVFVFYQERGSNTEIDTEIACFFNLHHHKNTVTHLLIIMSQNTLSLKNILYFIFFTYE